MNVNTEYWTLPPFTMANLTATLNPACVASAVQRHTPWNCIVAEVTAPFITTLPVFAWQSRYDSNQLKSVEIERSNDNSVNAYGKALEGSLRSWVGAGAGGSGAAAGGAAGAVEVRGAFVDGCYSHCDYSRGITAGDSTPRTALKSWWEAIWADESTANRSVLWAQGGVYPCEDCCPQPSNPLHFLLSAGAAALLLGCVYFCRARSTRLVVRNQPEPTAVERGDEGE